MTTQTEPNQIHLRLFAAAPASRSADLAAVLTRRLAVHGQAQVTEHGSYWKIPEYLEFMVVLSPTGSVPVGAAQLKAEQPTGWTKDIWNHQDDGSVFLIPEIRWADLITDDA